MASCVILEAAFDDTHTTLKAPELLSQIKHKQAETVFRNEFFRLSFFTFHLQR